VSEARNQGVHGSDATFSDRVAQRFEFEVEAVIRAVVGWVIDHGATTQSEHLAAIAALPAA
jgi:hypothetical protein